MLRIRMNMYNKKKTLFVKFKSAHLQAKKGRLVQKTEYRT